MEPPAGDRADAFKLSLEIGDVVVEFGRLARGPGDEPVVEATDRVVMPLETARRLLLSLNEAVLRHSAALRAAQAKALPPGQAAAATRPDQGPVHAPADTAGEMGAQLIRAVGDLGVPHQYERSFRVSQEGLQANRYLLSLNPGDLGDGARERILAICERFGMPAALRAMAGERFASANCVHFGFEGDGGVVCKLYLERKVPAEEAGQARRRGQPVLLHLAFKWNLARNEHVISEYLWHPELSAQEIEARLAGQIYRGSGEASLAIASAVLALAASKVDAKRLQYLEVQEPGTGRRSFDLNLYNAKLQVKDIQPALYRMRDQFGLRPGQFQALVDQIRAKALGHLAGGLHRDGRDFFNLYYGVAGLPHFQERFRPG